MEGEASNAVGNLVITVMAVVTLFAIGFRMILVLVLKQKLSQNPLHQEIVKDPEIGKFVKLYSGLLQKSIKAGSNRSLHPKGNGKGYTIWYGSDYFSFTVLDDAKHVFEVYLKIDRAHTEWTFTNEFLINFLKKVELEFVPHRQPVEEE